MRANYPQVPGVEDAGGPVPPAGGGPRLRLASSAIAAIITTMTTAATAASTVADELDDVVRVTVDVTTAVVDDEGGAAEAVVELEDCVEELETFAIEAGRMVASAVMLNTAPGSSNELGD